MDKNKTYINVASGSNVISGYINIDNSIFLLLSYLPMYMVSFFFKKHYDIISLFREARKKHTLYRRDCRKDLTMFSSGSVDHIVCSHFLEHLYQNEVEIVLKGFRRILKNDGTMHIVLPDLSKQIAKYLKNKKEKNVNAADVFVSETEFTHVNRKSFIYNLMTLIGSFGMQHFWMYDYDSFHKILVKNGFEVIDKEKVPDSEYKSDDKGAFSIFVKKGI